MKLSVVKSKKAENKNSGVCERGCKNAVLANGADFAVYGGG